MAKVNSTRMAPNKIHYYLRPDILDELIVLWAGIDLKPGKARE